jgi:hypothetical protein
MKKALYRRDKFVTSCDLNHSCRDLIANESRMFRFLKRYARKHQRTVMRNEVMKMVRDS